MRTVLIDVNGKVFDTDRVVKVSKSQNEDVRWVAMGGGGPWMITFDKVTGPNAYPVASGSPFTATTYDVGPGGSGETAQGPVAGLVGWTYKYNVKDMTGQIKDDPDVDVEG
jgi:hypothetical protein